MKQRIKIFCAVLLVILIAIGGFYVVNLLRNTGNPLEKSSASSAQDKALAFIKNVLPIDSTQYNITLINQTPGTSLSKPINSTREDLTYLLQSKNGAIDVICTVQDDVLYVCYMYVRSGLIISDRTYSNVIDSVTSFLQKYQYYSTLDSTKMIDMLSNIDLYNNATAMSGSLKLTVTHIDLPDTAFGNSVDFRWVQSYNECDYLSIEVGFKDGIFEHVIDHRVVYAIGDTTVNISRERAVEIAIEAMKATPYNITHGLATGFTTTKDNTVVKLQPVTKESNVLYPAWGVMLYLIGTPETKWPDPVYAIFVGIWAGTGEVYLVSPQTAPQLFGSN